MHTQLINEDIFINNIELLFPTYKTLEFLAVEIKGDTIIKDCTKILLDNKTRFDYINNKLVKIEG